MKKFRAEDTVERLSDKGPMAATAGQARRKAAFEVEHELEYQATALLTRLILYSLQCALDVEGAKSITGT